MYSINYVPFHKPICNNEEDACFTEFEWELSRFVYKWARTSINSDLEDFIESDLPPIEHIVRINMLFDVTDNIVDTTPNDIDSVTSEELANDASEIPEDRGFRKEAAIHRWRDTEEYHALYGNEYIPMVPQVEERDYKLKNDRALRLKAEFFIDNLKIKYDLYSKRFYTNELVHSQDEDGNHIESYERVLIPYPVHDWIIIHLSHTLLSDTYKKTALLRQRILEDYFGDKIFRQDNWENYAPYIYYKSGLNEYYVRVDNNGGTGHYIDVQIPKPGSISGELLSLFESNAYTPGQIKILKIRSSLEICIMQYYKWYAKSDIFWSVFRKNIFYDPNQRKYFITREAGLDNNWEYVHHRGGTLATCVVH
jgi:hypothetical protein